MRDWLLVLRQHNGWSQQDMAIRSRISQQYYSFIESGERRPSPEVAHRIADVLGFSDTWYRLLEDDSSEKKA